MPRRLLFAGVLLLGPGAAARTLLVGPGQPFALPSAAAHAASDGDTVLIDPGEYYDCSVWVRNHLIIAGARPGVVITDTTCQGKALFVVSGADTTIRDLTLARARVADGNGAGIRQEGRGLLLERVQFVNNQVGLLSGGATIGDVILRECAFEGGGAGGDRPTFAVHVDAADLLRIERSAFKGVKGGQIASFAARTELIGNQIGTGTGAEPAVAVLSASGHLVMQDNLLSVGPAAPRLAAAVLVTGQDVPELRHNRILNSTGQPAAMLLDWTSNDPVLEGNQVGPGDAVLSTTGLWRHRAAVLYHSTNNRVWALGRQVKQVLLGR